jgi:two-component system chemotaxis sensor kinase CheA
LTLAIIKAMLVQVHNEIFAIPLISIRETIKISPQGYKVRPELRSGKSPRRDHSDIRLDKVAGYRIFRRRCGSGRFKDIPCDRGIRQESPCVDGVVRIGEQDIAVKPLGAMIKRTKGSRCDQSGDGRVALILDIMSLK